MPPCEPQPPPPRGCDMEAPVGGSTSLFHLRHTSAGSDDNPWFNILPSLIFELSNIELYQHSMHTITFTTQISLTTGTTDTMFSRSPRTWWFRLWIGRVLQST